MAPAGSKEALIAAVKGGADAVYAGGRQFSARASAANFNNEELKWAVDYCHLRGVKFYLTINTLISDKELADLSDYISFVSEIGVDAIIVQDLGVAMLAREVAPELSLHASTQATVIDAQGAKYFKNLGFSRVVVARELPKDKIAKIVASSGTQVEMFVHGAICLCYSGQCLMSSFIGGRSGNRGKCAQPCRLPYKAGDKEGFLLSPKDMCLINYLKDIKNIGVSSLKIEGRMKGPEYVGTVVGIYRKYLDNDITVSREDYQSLERIFYRGGLTDGYFTGKKGKEMFCHTKPDNPYKLQSKEQSLYDFERKISVGITCQAQLGKPLKVIITDSSGHMGQGKGEKPAQPAINKPLTKERLEQQLLKLGDTTFKCESIEIDLDDGISLPISEINAVRRSAASALEQSILQGHRRKTVLYEKEALKKRKPSKHLETAIQVSSLDQLEFLNPDDYDYLYLPLDEAVKLKGFTPKTYVVMPLISEDEDWEVLKKLGIKNVVATNIGQIQRLGDMGCNIVLDFTLNIFNHRSANHFSFTQRNTLSVELSLPQIKGIDSQTPVEVVAYGRIPLMITENCLIKSSAGCKNANAITDRTGTKFPAVCLKNCRNQILNSKPVVMSDKLDDIKQSGADVIRLMFTVETSKQCKEIVECYKKGIKPFKNFTRGKFYKGV